VLSTYTSYSLVADNLQRALDNTAKQPEAARETQYYKDHVGDIKSIDDFMANTRIYNYVMKAYGLEDMSYAKGMIRKVLDNGVEWLCLVLMGVLAFVIAHRADVFHTQPQLRRGDQCARHLPTRAQHLAFKWNLAGIGRKMIHQNQRVGGVQAHAHQVERFRTHFTKSRIARAVTSSSLPIFTISEMWFSPGT
jgi:hypothetical protein